LKKKISNIEQRMLKAEAIGQRKNFIIRHSLLDIRYSFSAHGKLVIIEFPTAKETAKHLPQKSLCLRLQFPTTGASATHHRLPTTDYNKMRSFPRRRVNFSRSRYSSKGMACLRVMSKSSLNSATPNLVPGVNLPFI
jgi:hypothetical protein